MLFILVIQNYHFVIKLVNKFVIKFIIKFVIKFVIKLVNKFVNKFVIKLDEASPELYVYQISIDEISRDSIELDIQGTIFDQFINNIIS